MSEDVQGVLADNEAPKVLNHIERMVAKLCPRGVEYVKVGDIADIGTGSSDRKDAVPDGEYPFYVRFREVLRSASYLFDEESVIIPGEGGIGEIFHFVSGKYNLHQRAYRVSFRVDYINTKFAYYYFAANFKKFILAKSVNATVKSIRKPMVQSFQIPVPPLEVQNAIVEILDKFTELEAELEAELAARRAQYEYYRNSLFENLSGGGSEILGNLVKIKNGKSYKGFNSGDIPVYGSGGIMTYVDRSAYSGPSVLIPRKGSIGNIFYVDTPFWNVDTIFYTEINREQVTPKYLYHALQVQNLSELNTAGGVPSLTQTVLKRVRIPLPSIAEQERIVKILDKFDALVNDISSGLPAEIEARRKQYEYYRDLLLTFPSASESTEHKH